MRGIVLLALASLVSCGPTRVDCSHYEAPATLRCMDKNKAKGERAMLLECFPYSKPERIEGTWYYGFELNAFYEGTHAPSAYLGLPGPVDTGLEYDPHLPVDGDVRVLQMELIGRRSQCPMGLPERIIVVDRVISSRVTAVAR